MIFFGCGLVDNIILNNHGKIIYPVLTGLFAGFVFFLMGMDQMTLALKNYTGKNIKNRVLKITQNRFAGFFSGTVISALLQSCSAATVLIVGFVQAGLLKFPSSLAIILGANVGATITTQIIAFNIFEYSVLFIGSGFFLRIFSKKALFKNIGNTLAGVGLLFYGMDLMSQAAVPLKSSSEAVGFLKNFTSPLYSLTAGMLFTCVIQSSNASTGIAMVMAQEGLISLEAAVAIMMGANIGTCITAFFASIGASRDSKRTALAHVFFKITGAAVFFIILEKFICFSVYITSFAGDSPARIIANAHSLYNLGIAFIFLPFTGCVSLFLVKIFPAGAHDDEIVFQSVLDSKNIPPPDAAIELARAEIARTSGLLLEMTKSAAVLFVKKKIPRDRRFPSKNILEGIKIRENEIIFLEEKISDYLFKVVRNDISRDKVLEAYAFISIARDLGNISNLVSEKIPYLYRIKTEIKTEFSEAGQKELADFQLRTVKQISRLKRVFDEPDFETAVKIMKKEQKYTQLHIKYRTSHLSRIAEMKKESVETHKLHMELMNLMISLISYTANISKTWLEMIGNEKKRVNF
jgi:phosphate:Na+ symporter